MFIGAGAIGSLFGGYIANIKSDVYNPEITFICRRDHADAINNNGLRIQKKDSIYNIKKIKAFDRKESIKIKSLEDPFSAPDFLFFTIKAYDLEIVMKMYKNLVNNARRVIILQNGIGNEEIVKKFCLKTKIMRMVTNNGALLSEPGKIIHTGSGITKLGFPFINDDKVEKKELKKINSDLLVLKDILNSAGLHTTISNNIIRESWEKIMINIGINAIGALTRLTNGELLKSDRLKKLMGGAVEEALMIAKMKKIDLPEKNYVTLMYQVALDTAGNKNSMLQDILQDKLTEIDFINGKIVSYAKKLNIEVPINEVLTSLIKGLEFSQF
jgi:2-dehydropantoate 2-reductase